MSTAANVAVAHGTRRRGPLRPVQDENIAQGKPTAAAQKRVTRRTALVDVSNVQSQPQAHPKTHPYTKKVNVLKKPKEEEEEIKIPSPMMIDDEGWEDLDKNDANDPFMVSEYVVEIMAYLRDLELKMMPDPNYIEGQKELKWRMREILVDWMVEVHWKFKLLPETLYLAVNIVDRFLSQRVVSLVKLQLVGIAALLIASKYEEILSPSITNFVYLSDGGYDEAEIIKAESYILATLGFRLGTPNPMMFLRRISKAEEYDPQTRTVAKYLMEITLLDHRFLSCPPSIIAASAIWLARKMLKRGEWSPNMIHYSGYQEHQLKQCVDWMLNTLSVPSKHKNIYKKYASRKYMKVSVYTAEYINSHISK